MAELLLKFWQESGDSSEYYTKFMQFLEDATRYQGESSFMLSGFISQLMENLGFGMQFNTCVRCGYSFEKVPLVLAPEQGGAICHNCSTGVLGQSPEFIHTLRKITRGSLKPDAHMQKIPPQDCEEFLLQFMMGHLQMYPVLKSRDSLRQIRSLLG
jgi:DNA repair protein RecO